MSEPSDTSLSPLPGLVFPIGVTGLQMTVTVRTPEGDEVPLEPTQTPSDKD